MNLSIAFPQGKQYLVPANLSTHLEEFCSECCSELFLLVGASYAEREATNFCYQADSAPALAVLDLDQTRRRGAFVAACSHSV